MDDMLAMFMEITSVSDRDTATNFLEMAGGDLDTAVSLYFEHGVSNNIPSNSNGNISGDVNVESDADVAQRLQNSLYQEQGQEAEEIPRAPIEPIHEQLLPNDPFPHYSDRLVNSNTIFGSHRSNIFGQRIEGDDDGDDDEDYDDDYMNDDRGLHSAFDEFHANDEQYELMDEDNNYIGSSRRVRRRSNRARERQTATQIRLANLFRPPFDIIERLDLETARVKARETQKWIMVNIQDMTNFNCQTLNRDFWSNVDIKNIVRENFIFLQYHHDSGSGEHYRNLYPFTEFPHISILDPMTGERLKMWSGNPEIPKFIQQIVEFMDQFSLDKTHKNPLVQHKSKVNVDELSEEQQIELAKKKSMNHQVEDNDDVVVIKGTADDPVDLDSSEDNSDIISFDSEPVPAQPVVNIPVDTESIDLPEQDVNTAITKKEDRTESTYSEILASILSVDHPEPPNDPTTTTRIQIRSGTGKRIVKRFSLDDLVKSIYEVVKFNFEEANDHDFILTSQRENLFDYFDKKIGEAGLKNASILLEISDD